VFTKSIGDRWRSANRRRDERDVRVHSDAGQLGAPVRHRSPARGAHTVLPQIQQQTPAAAPEGSWHVATNHGHLKGQPDLYIVHHTGTRQLIRFGTDRDGAYAKMRELNRAAEPHTPAPVTLERLALERGRLLGHADELAAYRAELEQQRAALFDQCQQLWDEEHEERRVAEDYRHWIAQARYGEPQRPAEVPQAPVDDREEPELDPFQQAEAEQDAAEAQAQHALDAYIAAEPPHDEELPEALTAGPAAVPQLQRERDTETIRLPWGRPAVLDDTLTEIYRADGVER